MYIKTVNIFLERYYRGACLGNFFSNGLSAIVQSYSFTQIHTCKEGQYIVSEHYTAKGKEMFSVEQVSINPISYYKWE